MIRIGRPPHTPWPRRIWNTINQAAPTTVLAAAILTAITIT